MPRRWRLIGVLVPIAIVLVVVTSNVRLATGNLTLYDFLFDRHDVPQRTGITSDGLSEVGRDIQGYFFGDTEPLFVEAEVLGVRTALFTEVEVAHMADVKGLFDLTWRVQRAAALFLGIMVLAAAITFRRGAVRVAARWVRNGALLTAAGVAGIGAVSLVAFDPLFDLFHQLGFRNDFWQFDARTSMLVRVFPFGFWRDVTLLIGVAALVESAALFAIARWVLRRSRQAPTATLQTGTALINDEGRAE